MYVSPRYPKINFDGRHYSIFSHHKEQINSFSYGLTMTCMISNVSPRISWLNIILQFLSDTVKSWLYN